MKKEGSLIAMKYTPQERQVVDELRERFGSEAFSEKELALARHIIVKMKATLDNSINFVHELMDLLEEEADNQVDGEKGKATARMLHYAFQSLRLSIAENLGIVAKLFEKKK